MLCRLMLIKFNSFDRAEKTVGSAGDRTREPTQTGERGEGQYHSDTLTYAATHTFKHTLQPASGAARGAEEPCHSSQTCLKKKKKRKRERKEKKNSPKVKVSVWLLNVK